MKLKFILPAATLAIFAASTIQADEDDPESMYWKGEAYTLKAPEEKKTMKKSSQLRKKRATPPGSESQQAVLPGGSTQAKDKRGKEGCEERLSC